MDSTLFHGNKIGLASIVILALSFCTAVGTYRLKKSAEIKLWEKSLIVYSAQLKEKNQAAIKNRSLR
jgi:hypothetical protein